jgi:hypothetical protein
MIKEAEIRKREAELDYELGLPADSRAHPDLTQWAEKLNGSQVHADGKEFSCSLLTGLKVTDPNVAASDSAHTVLELVFGDTILLDGRYREYVGTLSSDFRILCVVFSCESGELELCSPAAIKFVQSSAAEVEPDALMQAWGLFFETDRQGMPRKSGLRPRRKAMTSSTLSDAEDESPKPRTSKRTASRKQTSANLDDAETKNLKRKVRPPAQEAKTAEAGKAKLKRKLAKTKKLHTCYCNQCKGNKAFMGLKTITEHTRKYGPARRRGRRPVSNNKEHPVDNHEVCDIDLYNFPRTTYALSVS